MRLFVAVDLGEPARAVARSAIEELRRDPTIRRLDPRWVAAENVHITVRFIGHVAEDKAPSLLAALTTPIAIAPFEATVEGCGAFPPSGAVRVIWLGLPGGCDALAAIYEEMNRRLLPLGLPAEARPFSAHVTLARVKDAPRKASTDARRTLARCRVSRASWMVREATIFESHLSPRGPRYEPLARIPLTR